MTILDLQRRIMEAGRIRIGAKAERGNPTKLDTFRLTSASRDRIHAAAGMFGGTPREWRAPAGPQWEVFTEVDTLDVIVPPSDMAFSQWYETWSGGGCKLRCDGVTETIGDRPCVCDPDERECKPTTRLSVMLRDLAGLGVWRLESHGYYAAVELAGAVQVVQAAAGAGVMLPAALRLEARQVKRTGKPTMNFAVPVLDVEITPAQLLGGQSGGMALGTSQVAAAPALGPATPGEAPALPAPTAEPAPLTPVPPTVQERPVGSVADQVKAGPAPRRSGGAAPIPSTGLAPRTAAQAEAGAAPERVAEPQGAQTVSALAQMTKAKLVLRCRDAGLPVSGTKDELIARLEEHAASGEVAEPEAPSEPEEQPSSFDRDGAQKAFHARLRDLGLDYEAEVKPWMVEALGASLSKLPDGRLRSLLDGMEKRGDQFVTVVRDHAAAVADPQDEAASATAEEVAPEPDDASAVASVGEGPSGAAPDSSPAGASPSPTGEATPPAAAGESLADRAHRRAAKASTHGQLQARCRAAWRVLASRKKTHEIYAKSWATVSAWLDGDASVEDWSSAPEIELRRHVEDLERQAARFSDEREQTDA